MAPMHVVHVRFPQAARSAACQTGGHELEVGDRCLVETSHGLTFGVVTQTVLDNPFYDDRSGARLPRVSRPATQDDEEAYAHKLAREREARNYCQQKIDERKLGMRLGHVEQFFDGKKLIFYFTADKRIDFRALVRDLAARFRTRIELRQVGARDDAGMHGGCGPCGRSLCCSTFLRKFEPVSIKMAKVQGLSLNPSKISGMCGRLMCCLKYEYDPSGAKIKKKRAGGGCGGCAVRRN
jgi:cell fate regulator YaaT (PSP1 superfamily)